MTSEIRANTLKNRVGLGTISFTNTGAIVSGIVTANSFSGVVKATNLSANRVVFTQTGGQLEASGNLTYNGTTLASGSPVDINADLDVDGHTNLDNVSIAGITTYSKSGSALRLNDGSILRLGNADTDFFLYHDGNNIDYISAGASKQLRLTTDDFVIKGANNTETLMTAAKDGAVSLYHNNTLRLETRTNDVKFHGGLVAVDNVKLQLGSSGDLSLYHDGTNSYIDNVNTGILRIRGGAGGSGRDIQIQAKNGEYSINAIPNGAVELFHDNDKKFQTQASGAKIFNTAGSGGTRLEIQGQEGQPAYLQLNADDGDDNADYSRIYHDTDGSVYFQNFTSGSWETNIKTTGNGSVVLYHDNNPRMHTDTTGITVQSRITAAGDTNTYINVGSSADTLEFYTGGSNVFKFDSSGRIVVNNSSAQDGAAKLQIKGGTAANILTADITDETVAVFGGSSPGTTQTGYGAGIVIKPIISRGSHFFLGACNSGTNQEGNGIFVIRQGHLAANSTERLRINQNGHVEIQDRLWVPSNKLISLGNVSSSPHFSFYKDDATGVNHITSNSGAEIKVSSGNGNSNGIEFWDYTGVNKRCQIDGQGIKFGTDTAEASALDDYEEGSWTPLLPSGGSATMVGRYTKIGNTVLWQLTINSISGAASFRISGLPYTVNNSWGGGISISNYGGTYPILVFAHNGDTKIYFRNTNNVTYNINAFTGKFFYVHGFYYVNA